MQMRKIGLAAILGAMALAAPALAQDEPDTTIKGNTTINASAKNVATTAAGKGAKATTDVGTISATTINGNTTINASAENIATTAAGADAVAATEVGAIHGARIDGNTTINASAENVATTAAGKGACAATRVGAIGKRPCK